MTSLAGEFPSFPPTLAPRRETSVVCASVRAPYPRLDLCPPPSAGLPAPALRVSAHPDLRCFRHSLELSCRWELGRHAIPPAAKFRYINQGCTRFGIGIDSDSESVESVVFDRFRFRFRNRFFWTDSDSDSNLKRIGIGIGSKTTDSTDSESESIPIPNRVQP